MASAVQFPTESEAFLELHLPPKNPKPDDAFFTTVTFATSLDSQISLSPGAPTLLSGPQSMAMTHYLRSRYDAILIGVGTAVADDPTLNCEIEGVGGYGGEGLDGQPRPIIIDPRARWDFTENHQLFKLAKEGKGRAPFIITGPVTPPAAQKAILDSYGGKFISLKLKVTVGGSLKWLDWKDILDALSAEGLKSAMIEGGADVINSLLVPEYFSIISSVVVTIAPTWLGQGGVVVSPGRRLDDDGKPTAAARLDQVAWKQFGEDIVLCGKVKI